MKVKYLPVIFWALCILLATNTHSFQSLLFSREIGLNIRLFPNLSELFIINDIHLDSKSYVFQKIGHVISFGILFILLAKSISANRKAIILCSLFAFFTELLQLFFERSGRFSDVLIDMAGIYIAYRLSIYVKEQGGLNSVFWETLQKIIGVFADDKRK
ncbi:VanZ family protein [Planococcus halotolerans]|uniref:VanZ family protein n=1 Tax=Planococcus halotolerans TaxID=2233542 RepID=A0A365L6E6_9BACL|nr:VanZ family protein [Planococcus halotolerans]RAZ80711.1 VanZ family protein [Planococcus halotolerans]